VRLKDFITNRFPCDAEAVFEMFRVPDIAKRDINTFRFHQDLGFIVETHDKNLVKKIRKQNLWNTHDAELQELFGLLLTRMHLNFGPGT
jgi:hypothetical protein